MDIPTYQPGSESYNALFISGAQARLLELRQEDAAIRKQLEKLGARVNGHSSGNGHAIVESNSELATPKRRRKRMSAAARKAVSVRMKKYWKTWRAKN